MVWPPGALTSGYVSEPSNDERCRDVEGKVSHDTQLGRGVYPLPHLTQGKHLAHVELQYVAVEYLHRLLHTIIHGRQILDVELSLLDKHHKQCRYERLAVVTRSMGRKRSSRSMTVSCLMRALSISLVIPPGPGPTSHTWWSRRAERQVNTYSQWSQSLTAIR